LVLGPLGWPLDNPPCGIVLTHACEQLHPWQCPSGKQQAVSCAVLLVST
jgi:hypothetical protein